MATEQLIAVVDVETPNGQNNSICSIGIVIIDGNEIKDNVYYLVNPEARFDKRNIEIHGITERDVADAPTFPEVWEDIKEYFSMCLIVGHNISFDLSCINKTLKRYKIDVLPAYCIDTCEISRGFLDVDGGNALSNLCDYFDIELVNHHNASDDSYATAELFLELMNEFDVDLDSFVQKYDFPDIEDACRCSRKITYSNTTQSLQELQGILWGITSDDELNDKEIYAIKRWVDIHSELKGNYPFDRIYNSLEAVLRDNVITESERDELLTIFNSIIDPVGSTSTCDCDMNISGKKICLTGDFDCMSKSDLATRLEEKGAIVKGNVVKGLDYLIVGDRGSSQWAQGNYGTKIKKAMELNSKGSHIEIIKESDFLSLIEL